MRHKNPMRWAPALALAAAVLAAAAPSAAEEPEGGYEMTTYVVGFLHRGPAWTPEPTPEVMELQKGHLAHIQKMADSGELILAGPFMDDGDLRGLFVFKLEGETPEEMIAAAEKLAAQDPMVQAKRLVLKFHPWYSAAGINIDQGR